MRGKFASALLATTLVMWLAPPPAPAAAAGRVLRAYEGTTSAGGTIALLTTFRDGVTRFQAVGLEDVAGCADGTSVPFGHGFDLSPRGIRLEQGQLQVENVGFSDAFFLAGTLGTKVGSGTLTHLFAALDVAEEPQLCTTDELAWTAHRVPSPVGEGIAGVVFTETVAGATEAARLTGSGAPVRVGALALRERLRSYEGRTSARQPLFIITAKRQAGVELLELGFAWDLACGDGASVSLGFFILFAGERLDAGQLNYDASAPEIGLHVNGRLGAHAGEGTTSAVIPALTADLQAQSCRTGDLTWHAWRTDAGARPV